MELLPGTETPPMTGFTTRISFSFIPNSSAMILRSDKVSGSCSRYSVSCRQKIADTGCGSIATCCMAEVWKSSKNIVCFFKAFSVSLAKASLEARILFWDRCGWMGAASAFNASFMVCTEGRSL
ncbi:MAG: hypothetical protein ACLRMZ_20235 [Blautia marasmi]